MSRVALGCLWSMFVVVRALAAEPPAEPSEAPLSVAELTERIRPAVVVIHSAGRDGRQTNVGTGFVVSSDGLVATNFHVVGEGRAISVQLADGRRADVTAIHAFDRALDLAVLRVASKNLKALELANSDEARQGQAVIALGNPHGLKHSVAAGVVSGVREVDGRPMLQLEIAIEPGNSGGPLVDMQGRVLGIMTMKSLITPKLGFALAAKLLKPLLEKPNPIPMARWLTIGALDSRDWKPLFGARWQQRAGRITVEEPGDGFGGRSLCLWQHPLPERPFEMCVTLKLDDESGAAGLAFCADGEDRHYGFYPTAGRLRLTRFDGPDVTSWNILYDHPSIHYRPGTWNTLRVRLEGGRIRCFVNDHQVVEIADSGLPGGAVGLAKFRDTRAQFKAFHVGTEVPSSSVPEAAAAQIAALVSNLPSSGPLDEGLVQKLAADSAQAASVLRERALELDNRARQLRRLAEAAHERAAVDDLVRAVAGDDDKIDLFRCGLLVARLDNDEIDVDAYVAQLERMADELKALLAPDADDEAKLAALRKYLFEENGFHGSRGDYYNRSNSYLNEVLDDREGLPITLSILYMELARRVGLDVVGLGLPGHFIVGYRPAKGEMQLIDVFEGATSVTRDVAEARVRDTLDGEVTDEVLARYFEPVTKRAIVTRILTNLLGVANSFQAGHRYLNALLAIDPEQPMYRFMRAEIRSQLDNPDSARADIDWLLEREPAGINLDRVRQLQSRIERQ